MPEIRVFPRRTNLTPIDELAFVGNPPLFLPDGIEKILISVAFSWDKKEAERLYNYWKHIAPTTIGGPAFNEPSGEFVPGKFLRIGATITSRGCPNKCWFCSVWKRELELKELEIHPGNNIQDDNLLACSDKHIRAVFAMLKAQKGIEFTGGLEAKRLKDWHVSAFSKLSIKQMFFAYDTPDDAEPLFEAGQLLKRYGFNHVKNRCYVLIGFPKDTVDAAEKRLRQTFNFGFVPMAMLWKGEEGESELYWKRLQRLWARPAHIKHIMREPNA